MPIITADAYTMGEREGLARRKSPIFGRRYQLIRRRWEKICPPLAGQARVLRSRASLVSSKFTVSIR